MSTILHVQATVRGERSYTLRTARAFLESYLEAHPGDTVETVDLGAGSIPEFDATAVSGKYRILHGEPHSAEEAEAWKAVEATIEVFTRADKFLISSPMWNFGIPYRLKQYFDVIVQPGYTFSFSPEEGYKGLMTGKPCVLILSRGGEYTPGEPGAELDLQLPYLRTILGFMGVTEVDSIIVQPTLMAGKEVAGEKLSAAIAEAREKARDF
jgi:FMN-dependent NADH-azoreductase